MIFVTAAPESSLFSYMTDFKLKSYLRGKTINQHEFGGEIPEFCPLAGQKVIKTANVMFKGPVCSAHWTKYRPAELILTDQAAIIRHNCEEFILSHDTYSIAEYSNGIKFSLREKIPYVIPQRVYQFVQTTSDKEFTQMVYTEMFCQNSFWVQTDIDTYRLWNNLRTEYINKESAAWLEGVLTYESLC
jgi:hypothetical protein